VGEELYYFTVPYVVVAKVVTVGFEKNKVTDHQHQLLPRCHQHRRHQHQHQYHRREAHKGFLAKIAMTA
jgi:hypothetical protein